MPDTVQRMVEAIGRTVRDAIPWRARKETIVRDAYRRFADSHDGQIILADLARACETGSIMVAGDPFMTHYNLGKNAVLQHMKTQGEISDAYILRAVEADRARDAAAIANEE
jgi:hypothetical protein